MGSGAGGPHMERIPLFSSPAVHLESNAEVLLLLFQVYTGLGSSRRLQSLTDLGEDCHSLSKDCRHATVARREGSGYRQGGCRRGLVHTRPCFRQPNLAQPWEKVPGITADSILPDEFHVAVLGADASRCGGFNTRTQHTGLTGTSLYFTLNLLGTEFVCLSITTALRGESRLSSLPTL